MIITALSLFIAGSILCALAPNMPVLILARGLQGLGGGGIMPCVQTVISDVVSPRERGQYQAYFSGVWMAAGIGGPVLGGIFAEHLHWSMIFWINVPLGIASLAMLLPKMAKIPVFHRRRKIDWLGGVLLMASAIMFMLVLTWGGNRYLWLSPTIMAMVGRPWRWRWRLYGSPERPRSRSCRCRCWAGRWCPTRCSPAAAH